MKITPAIGRLSLTIRYIYDIFYCPNLRPCSHQYGSTGMAGSTRTIPGVQHVHLVRDVIGNVLVFSSSHEPQKQNTSTFVPGVHGGGSEKMDDEMLLTWSRFLHRRCCSLPDPLIPFGIERCHLSECQLGSGKEVTTNSPEGASMFRVKSHITRGVDAVPVDPNTQQYACFVHRNEAISKVRALVFKIYCSTLAFLNDRCAMIGTNHQLLRKDVGTTSLTVVGSFCYATTPGEETRNPPYGKQLHRK